MSFRKIIENFRRKLFSVRDKLWKWVRINLSTMSKLRKNAEKYFERTVPMPIDPLHRSVDECKYKMGSTSSIGP